MNPRFFIFLYPRVRCARYFSTARSYRNNVQQEEASTWLEKITYNSYLEKFTFRPNYRQRIQEPMKRVIRDARALKRAKEKDLSVAAQYLMNDLNLNEEVEDNHSEFLSKISGEPATSNLQFPFRILTEFEHTDVNREEDESKVVAQVPVSDETVPAENWINQYGIPDQSVPASDVPCGGCGAHLHCQDAAIPGYMPSETFKVLSSEDLKTQVCQRCYFLKAHNAALNVNISPKMYPEILKDIENKKALVLLVVDLVDFPCSIWPGIANIIGHKRPVILVGNKVDLIPRDSKKYLEHIKTSLKYAAEDVGLTRANIVDVALISAASGYGIEDLITTIFKKWGNKGDIYIMGCTNVGKSSLFNVFLQSDLCKVQAVDLVQRATVSAWPGTTLNLLKFPVLKPDGWRLHLRYERLKKWGPDVKAEEKLREFQLKQTNDPTYASLIGYVGRSSRRAETEDEVVWLNTTQDVFQVNPHTFNLPKLSQTGKWDPHDPAFAFGQWCYDTPGTVNENQILDKLLLPELMKVLPKKTLQPRSFYLRAGLTMFVGGLARIDYGGNTNPIVLTVFSSDEVPITVAHTTDAEEIYEKALGTPIFGVPTGGEDRLKVFPRLKATEFQVTGEGRKCSCCDVVLSAIGWVAVTADKDEPCSLTVHTLNGAGVFLRQPALLPYMVNTKGKRIRDTVAYNKHQPYIPNPRLFY